MFRKLFRYFRNLFNGTKKIEKKVKETLEYVTLPDWIQMANSQKGIKEYAGKKKSNPQVENYFKISGYNYEDDISWCAAFINYCLKKSGKSATDKLNARSYIDYGHALEYPKIGSICVIWRTSPKSWKGHVFFVIDSDDKYVYGLGGNQSDEVNIQKYPKSRVLAYRWPV